MERVTVRFEGRVQGVGFRITTCELAQGFDVVGQVKNVPDGTVELIAEGAPEEVVGFVKEVSNRLSRFIQKKNEQWTAHAEPSFSDFQIADTSF